MQELREKIENLRKKISEKEKEIEELNQDDCPYGFYCTTNKNNISVYGIYEKKSLTLSKDHWKMYPLATRKQSSKCWWKKPFEPYASMAFPD